MDSKTRVSCSLCSYEIDPNSCAYTFCVVCNESYLCMRCSISQDAVICNSCIDGNDYMSKRVARMCPGCHIAWEVNNKCKSCKSFYCSKCYEKHPCFECKEPGCSNVGTYEVCCQVKRCEACHSKHQKTNCRLTMYYMCHECCTRVYTFGSDQFRCPVEGCALKYGCVSMQCNLLERFNDRGIYCKNHTSQNACPGCKMIYPLDPTYGNGHVRILTLLGAYVMRREFCGDCMKRIRAFVESLLIVTKRQFGEDTIFRFPKILIDMIVFNALNSLGRYKKM